MFIGDSGYGQQPWLMTPIAEPINEKEERYNQAHQKARHSVERCIGVLKSRFRCLCKQRVLMYSPSDAGAIINACAILHNIMIEENYPLPPENEIEDEVEEDEEGNIDENPDPNLRSVGLIIRNNVIETYF